MPFGITSGFSYGEILTALGRYLEDKRLKDICILEVDGGVVISGTAVVSTYEGYNPILQTHTLGKEDLMQLLKGVRR